MMEIAWNTIDLWEIGTRDTFIDYIFAVSKAMISL
jgi:hypothetical protein